MAGRRLDVELVERNLAASRSGARRAILDGKVAVDGIPATRPGRRVAPASVIGVTEDLERYVGRGAHKLAAAFAEFGVRVAGRSAVDVGAATGGFTDVLLQQGAASVAAVDVGHHQLHPRLRSDSRVAVFEGCNIRDTAPDELGGPFDVVVADLSFISLRVVAASLAALGRNDADWVLLVKPQFEVGRDAIGRGGVVRTAEARGAAACSVAADFARLDLPVVGAVASPLLGGDGNREALVWLRRGGRYVGDRQLYKVLADE